MASAPPDPQSPARRFLLRALSLPLPGLPLPLPSSRPQTRGPEFELHLLEPQQRKERNEWDARYARSTTEEHADFANRNEFTTFPAPPPHLRRRQTTTTVAAAPGPDEEQEGEDDDIIITRLPWPAQAVGAANTSSSSFSRPRRSLESCFSDASSLSTLSESEPRATPARPKVPRSKTREAESEAIWRDLWI